MKAVESEPCSNTASCIARRLGASPSHPWRVLWGLRTQPVIDRQIGSKPSARQKGSRKLSIPWARVGGIPTIGSMVAFSFLSHLSHLPPFVHSSQ
jgi:hypothetical protein